MSYNVHVVNKEGSQIEKETKLETLDLFTDLPPAVQKALIVGKLLAEVESNADHMKREASTDTPAED